MTVSERAYQVIIGVLVLIILIGAWFVFAGGRYGVFGLAGKTATTTPASGTEASENYPSSSGAAVQNAPAGDSVVVADQTAAAKMAVGSLTLGQPGWVAVRDANGRILGAGWFPAGTHSNVSVPLLRATVAGQRYQVLLYADNGDKKFELHTDTLVTNSDGSVAGTNFTAK